MSAATPQRKFSPRRQLGRTGFTATLLGIGDLADRAVPLEQCVATVQRAMDYGLNVIDTAPSYEDGYSEQIVGSALKGRREGMFLINKIDEHDDPVGPQVDASLHRLGQEMVDLFVFHALSELAAWERIAAPGGGMDQLSQCIRAGKARFKGISSHNPDVLRLAIESGLCDVVLFPVGPFVDPRYIHDILPLARQRGVGAVCFKSFGAGKLLGDTEGYNRPLQQRPRGKLSSGGEVPRGAATLPRLQPQECVQYTLTCDPDVTLLGMSFPNEVDTAIQAALDFTSPLSPRELAEIRARAAVAIQGKGECWWNPS